MHAPDCALQLYRDIDPATLKKPLACDCEESDDKGVPMLGEADQDENQPTTTLRTARPGEVTLTGDAARAYKQLATAETALKAAQKRKDEALAAFLGAVTG